MTRPSSLPKLQLIHLDDTVAIRRPDISSAAGALVAIRPGEQQIAVAPCGAVVATGLPVGRVELAYVVPPFWADPKVVQARQIVQQGISFDVPVRMRGSDGHFVVSLETDRQRSAILSAFDSLLGVAEAMMWNAFFAAARPRDRVLLEHDWRWGQALSSAKFLLRPAQVLAPDLRDLLRPLPEQLDTPLAAVAGRVPTAALTGKPLRRLGDVVVDARYSVLEPRPLRAEELIAHLDRAGGRLPLAA